MISEGKGCGRKRSWPNFKVISSHFPGDWRKPQQISVRIAGIRAKILPGTTRIRSRNVNHSITRLILCENEIYLCMKLMSFMIGHAEDRANSIVTIIAHLLILIYYYFVSYLCIFITFVYLFLCFLVKGSLLLANTLIEELYYYYCCFCGSNGSSGDDNSGGSSIIIII
jgi:hypothetical protein